MERGKVVNPVAGKALAIGGISVYFQGGGGKSLNRNENKTKQAFSLQKTL